jgi:hypothetical protein
MSYAHYWHIRNDKNIDDEKWNLIIKDVKKLFEYFKIQNEKNDGFQLAGWNGHDEPIINDNEISFNGKDNDSCESIIIYNKYNYNHPITENYYSDFCKTARKPYDIVVQMVLLIFKHHIQNDIIINSDGNDTDWINAIELTKEIFNYKDVSKEYISNL